MLERKSNWGPQPGAERRSGLFSRDGLLVRCNAAQCALRLKFQPAWLTRYRGIQFQKDWYHDPRCLQDTLLAEVRRLIVPSPMSVTRPHRLLIGLLLIKRGAITAEELREGLRLQQESGTGKLGYWLRQVSALTEDQICGALSQQWACPVFPSYRRMALPVFGPQAPFTLLAAANAVPVFAMAAGRQWHVAFSSRVDHTLLYALEEVLGCRTLACVARESVIKESLELLRKPLEESEIRFDTMRDPAEIASTICSYAGQMDVRRVTLVRAVGYLWAALFHDGVRRDLLFRVSEDARERVTKARISPKERGKLPETRNDGAWGAGGDLL
ncbi:MAG TPA: hypothetical protein VMJ35_10600 [Dongiaceae bacterium]|nr:hypothetical protein [Dongiaceae bacterium]